MAVKLMPVAPPPTDKAAAPELEKPVRGPRKRRKAAVYDAEGHEVLISLTCLKCHTVRPLSMFGLRKMADGAIRNQPWCRDCRGKSGHKKDKPAPAAEAPVAAPEPVVAPPEAPVAAAPAEPPTAAQMVEVLRAQAPAPANETPAAPAAEEGPDPLNR